MDRERRRYSPDSDAFRFRRTDLVVWKEGGKTPMSVSADRIAMGTRAWCAIVAANKLGAQVDTTGTLDRSPSLIEVYPGALAHTLRDGAASYKLDARVRRKLVSRVTDTFRIDCGKHRVCTDRCDDTDAFLAAVTAAVALAHSRGTTLASSGWRVRTPCEDERAFAAREGWIFFLGR